MLFILDQRSINDRHDRYPVILQSVGPRGNATVSGVKMYLILTSLS